MRANRRFSWLPMVNFGVSLDLLFPGILQMSPMYVNPQVLTPGSGPQNPEFLIERIRGQLVIRGDDSTSGINHEPIGFGVGIYFFESPTGSIILNPLDPVDAASDLWKWVRYGSVAPFADGVSGSPYFWGGDALVIDIDEQLDTVLGVDQSLAISAIAAVTGDTSVSIIPFLKARVRILN
jgi:hypothetical protein